MIATVTVAAALAQGPGRIAPAQPEPSGPVIQLRATTRVVEIDVSAQGGNGQPADDLKQPDFTVFDNGHPRPFTIFSFNPGAATTPATTPAATSAPASALGPATPPGAFSNLGAAGRGSTRRRHPRHRQYRPAVTRGRLLGAWSLAGK